jgi:hypothetical protein
MTASRSARYGGLLYSAAFAAWFLPAAAATGLAWDPAELAEHAFHVLLLTQVLALALLHPALSGGDLRQDLAAGMTLIATPWPLLAMILLAGRLDPLMVLLSQVFLAGTAAVLLALASGLRSRLPRRFQPHVPAVLQITVLGLVGLSVARWLDQGWFL